ncbi:MAG: DUF2267 domain-containing protein [Dehalococcoidia bacterium]
MKEKLIELVVEKAGIPAAAASAAVDTVFGFLKENPDEIRGLLGGDDDGGIMDDVKEKLGGLFGRKKDND